VLFHGQIQEKAQRLEGARDPAARDLVRLEAEDRLPLEANVPGVGLVDARHEVEQRRLARAVRPDHADDLALVDVQVEPVDAREAAEVLRHALDLEQPGHQTISTRALPSNPCGRAFMSTMRITPR